MKRLSSSSFKKNYKNNLDQHSVSTTGIFISYRRSDQPGFAGRLSDQLESVYGKERVFRDVESIAPGENFVSVINASLDCCGALIIIIGPSWLEEHNQQGQPRIFDKDDWVRAELEIALEKQKKIFPILVDGAKMPTADELPGSLHKILEFNAHEISDARWDYDVNRLLEELCKIPELEAISPGKIGSSAAGKKNLLQRQGKAGVAGAVLLVMLTLAISVYIFLNESEHCDDLYNQHFSLLSERIEKIHALGEGYLTTIQLQELSESSQAAALNNKTCCIILDKKQITSEQFLQCKTSVDDYSAKIDELIVLLSDNSIAENPESPTTTIEEQKTSAPDLIAIESKLTELISISDDLKEKVSKLQLVKETMSEEKQTQIAGEQVGEGTVNISSIYADTAEKIDGEVDYYLYEAELDAKGRRKEVTNKRYKPNAVFTVPPGTYHLWVRYGSANTTQQVEVESGKTTTLTIILNRLTDS